MSFHSFVLSSILPPGLWVWSLEPSYFWTRRTRVPLGMVEGWAGRISWDWRTSWSRRSISACGRLLGRPLLSQYLWAMWLCPLSVKRQSLFPCPESGLVLWLALINNMWQNWHWVTTGAAQLPHLLSRRADPRTQERMRVSAGSSSCRDRSEAALQLSPGEAQGRGIPTPPRMEEINCRCFQPLNFKTICLCRKGWIKEP